jgi:hypothetical protein
LSYKNEKAIESKSKKVFVPEQDLGLAGLS